MSERIESQRPHTYIIQSSNTHTRVLRTTWYVYHDALMCSCVYSSCRFHQTNRNEQDGMDSIVMQIVIWIDEFRSLPFRSDRWLVGFEI